MTMGELPAAAAAAAVRPTLLMVDDEPVNLQALYHALAGDHRVLAATDGEQGMALALSERPDLMLLDLVLPGVDGFDVCRRLKQDEATRDMPVIIVTSRNDEASETRGLDCGAVDFIAKPINPAIVRARVRTHLTLKRQADLLRRLAYLDGLTGLVNRRGFDDRLAVEWQRAQRSRQPLALLLVDVDHFKRYNDRHGHPQGDDCLRRLSAVLSAAVMRPGDLVARYGGEEFACILPQTPLAGAEALARRLDAMVRALGLPHGDPACGPTVTVSIGGAVAVPGPGRSIDALLAAADRELYRAKAQGRGRACTVGLEEPPRDG
jgi:diguanylate cyclase (GGDEF)-like protein